MSRLEFCPQIKEPHEYRSNLEVFRLAFASGLLALLVGPLCAQQPARHTLDLTVNKPETVGFSSERLERLHALMQDEVDKKSWPAR